MGNLLFKALTHFTYIIKRKSLRIVSHTNFLRNSVCKKARGSPAACASMPETGNPFEKRRHYKDIHRLQKIPEYPYAAPEILRFFFFYV